MLRGREDSGVVRFDTTRSPATRVSTVPTIPVTRPAARMIESSRYVVVVLPLVPVIPTRSMLRLGWS